jgi:ABC-type sugar transport system substrate-binding protein
MKNLHWLAVAMLGATAPAAAGTLGVIAFQASADGQARTVAAVQAAAAGQGHASIVLDAAGSLDRYRSQLDDLVDRHVDGIVLAMGKPVDSEPQLARAARAGVRLVSIETGQSDHVTVEIRSNREAAGRASAALLFRTVGDGGNVATVRFEKNAGAQASGRGFDEALAVHPAVTLLASHTMTDTEHWQQDVRIGSDAILDRHGRALNGIWAAFDGQAAIVDDAMAAHGWHGGRALVTIDGSQDIYRRIARPDSAMLATFAVPFEQMGQVAVERMGYLLQNPGEHARQTIEFEATQVDASNVDQFIDPRTT